MDYLSLRYARNQEWQNRMMNRLEGQIKNWLRDTQYYTNRNLLRYEELLNLNNVEKIPGYAYNVLSALDVKYMVVIQGEEVDYYYFLNAYFEVMFLFDNGE